ncbi:MAG: ABC transporter permease [Clostridia bacterium]|jgi:NitT/TauT family transport system permease protein|nr:ABC transporter permease [Clostridia bacterium]
MMKKLVSYSLAIASLIICWHLASILLAKPFLPTPFAAFTGFFGLLLGGQLTNHFLISLYRILVSLLLAFLLGVPLGLVLGRNQALDKFVAPIIYVLYPLPKVVFLPILVVLMGLGNLPKIALITLIVFFQVVVKARDAAKAIPFQSLQAIRSLNPTTWQIYYHLIWPFCLPKILTSLRITLGTAIAVLFFAETFASSDGLGYFILDAMERREYSEMYAGIITMAGLGLIIYGVIDFIEHRFCKWQRI